MKALRSVGAKWRDWWTARFGAHPTHARVTLYLPADAETTPVMYRHVSAPQAAPVTGGAPLQTLSAEWRNAALEVRSDACETLLLEVTVPDAHRSRAPEALAYLLEDQLLGDPADLECVPVVTASGRWPVAVTGRAQMARWREALSGAGLRPLRWLPANLALPWTAGDLAVARTGREWLVRSGEVAGCGVRKTDEAPLSLLGALITRSQTPLTRLRLLGDEALRTEADWASLGLPVTCEPWDPTDPRSDDPGLDLSGHGVKLAQSPWVRAFTPVAVVLAAGFAIIFLLRVAALARLAVTVAHDRHAMVTLYRQTFPAQPVILDPALQMHRGLTDLETRAGLAAPDDLLPLLTRVASAFPIIGVDALQGLRYRDRTLELRVSVESYDTLDHIEQRLAQAGLKVSATHTASDSGHVTGRLTVSPAP